MWTFFFDNPEVYTRAKAILVELLNGRQIDSMGVHSETLSLNVFTQKHKETFVDALKRGGIIGKSFIIVGPGNDHKGG